MATQGDKVDSNSTLNSQRQIILNLYNSGIEADVISYQLDVSQEEVNKVIEDDEKKKESKVKETLSAPSSMGGSFYLDAIVDIGLAIKMAQTRMWKALRSGPEFDISTEETDKILNQLSKSKVTFVILHIDLVHSTQLSMTLPLDRLTTIIQTFSQEMSLMVELYGGFVLKYVGDAVLAFFVTNLDKDRVDEDSKDGPQSQQQRHSEYYLPCINAINCARSMIKIVKEGINPILNQYDYPDIGVRIGIDVGEVAIIQYGWDVHRLEQEKQIIIKEPHYDILGHTVNVAVKMTGLAKPDSFTIGQSIYDILDERQKSTFEKLNVNPNVWSYLDEKTGRTYQVYSSTA
jgi:adenylate cyclase